jgi:hypothetical protein
MKVGDKVTLRDTLVQDCFATRNLTILEIEEDTLRVGKDETSPSIWVKEKNIV